MITIDSFKVLSNSDKEVPDLEAFKNNTLWGSFQGK